MSNECSGGGIRATKRGKGGKAEAQLAAALEEKVRRREATGVLDLDLEAVEDPQNGFATPQTLVEFLKTRWASHAMLVQNDTTRRTTANHMRYIAYFLGDLRLDQITAADVNKMALMPISA